MVLGDVSKAFNAQNVRLKLSTDEVVTIYDLKKGKAHPRSRIHTRGGATDFYSYPLISVTFTAVVSKDAYQVFNTLNSLDSRANLPLGVFTVIGENLDGQSQDDISVTFSATVPELYDEAADSGHYLIRATLIIKNTTYVVAP